MPLLPKASDRPGSSKSRMAFDLSHVMRFNQAARPLAAWRRASRPSSSAMMATERNAVSFINSLFNTYGSGLMSPKSGVRLDRRPLRGLEGIPVYVRRGCR
jgi:hypothetical protein